MTEQKQDELTQPKKIKTLYIGIFMLALTFFITGCQSESSFKKVDLDLTDPNQVNEEDSVVDELTPIIIIGDDVAVPVYKCSVDTDCNRCQDGDVYSQACVIRAKEDPFDGNCQGPLELVENCEDSCSAGVCIDKDEFTADDTEFSVGEDVDLEEILNDDAIVDNDDLVEPSNCSNTIEQCIGYRGIGSIYLDSSCECKFIYVPAYCNPMDPPCPDFSPRTDYPECACNK